MGMYGERAAGMLNRRRSKRASVVLPASVVTMSAYQYLEVVDLSATGAKLRGPVIPTVSKPALFRLHDFEVLCKVVWASDEMCGVRFDEPLMPRVLDHFNAAGTTARVGTLTTERAPEDETCIDGAASLSAPAL